MEIERKFLVRRSPRCSEYVSILQGYLCLGDKEEVRIRKTSNSKDAVYTLTVKRGTGMIRGEWEIPISEEAFIKLWKATEGRRIVKKRITIPYNDNTIYLDAYEDNLSGLLLAEVEFKSKEDALSFTPPEWFDNEVTHDEKYKNRSLVEIR